MESSEHNWAVNPILRNSQLESDVCRLPYT